MNIYNYNKEIVKMAKFKCKICGYVTDEFDELPADYKCPMCGAGIDMFEEVE